MLQYRYKVSCIDIPKYYVPYFDLNTAYYVYYIMTDAVVVCQLYSSVTACLVSIKHYHGCGQKALSISNNQPIHNSYTISYSISLYCDTKEVVYQYTQYVYHFISKNKPFKAQFIDGSTKFLL